MSKVNLYGDAKATAHAVDGGRKQAQLLQAQQAFRDNPNKDTQRAYATALFDIGKFTEAERVLVDLIHDFGEDRQWLYDLAFTYKNMNRLDEAKATFLKIIALDPKHSLARSAEHEVWMLDPEYKPSWVKK
jgi:tetratricopeptide (TPR) repeat protein